LLAEWYRERGQVARFEIASGDHDAALGQELMQLGFFQSGFHAALIRECEPQLPTLVEPLANVRPWFGEPDWPLYLIRVGGRPAAAAILFVRDRVGYCAVAPGFRGRGLHFALLVRRLQNASAAGVDFVCSGADFLSTSHRNMERAGMWLLFLRAVWTQVGSGSV
jgi:GNAT superfamily N-acetyltransferase